jgi:penicillin-insensitive murein DD-endopeptidase
MGLVSFWAMRVLPFRAAPVKRRAASNSMLRYAFLLLATLNGLSVQAAGTKSQCYGTVSNGRIENSVKLPERGPNFSAYSSLGAAAGRTHVHSEVAEIIVSAYGVLARNRPSTVYVYGETGWASGGRLRPHRTHQNGLSVDFFVPVRNAKGESVPLPTGITNKWGYDIEFDQAGKYDEYTIDFPALAEHLYQLQQVAQDKGAGISLVILDPAYLPKLFATARGPHLQKTLPFMKGKPWVRHDEHYHVDFRVACKPNAA